MRAETSARFGAASTPAEAFGSFAHVPILKSGVSIEETQPCFALADFKDRDKDLTPCSVILFLWRSP